MKEPIIESKEINEKSKLIEKIKIFGNRSSENHILNIASYFINNKNNSIIQLKPSDLELHFFTDSNISKIDKLIFKLQIDNNSFDPKRDTYKNMDNYKNITSKIEIKDEYYKDNNTLKEIIVDFIPKFHKNLTLDLSSFPFYHYNIEKKDLEKYNLKLKHNNKFVLCLYISGFNSTKIENTLKIVSTLRFMDKIFDYYENIYIIFEEKTENEIMKVINNDKLSEFILENNNYDEDKKIKYIFNILQIYDSYNFHDVIFNIFKEQNQYGPEFYFILDQNDKIISLSKKMNNISSKIYLLMCKIKNAKNKEGKNYTDILKEKKDKKINVFKQIIHFISKSKNLNYLFDLKFDISFLCSTNDKCSKISISKIESIKIEGKFRTKEYNYLKNLFDSLKKPNNKIYYKLEHLETIDLEIDFNEIICTKCKKVIPADKHFYYCYICKTNYCYKCVNEQLQKKGKEKYIDQKHNLLFFKTRNKKHFMNIDKSKLGNNKFSESINGDELVNSHSAMCNGCRGGFNHLARYVCLICRPGIYLSGGYIDYCQTCIGKMCDNEIEKIRLEDKAKETIYIGSNNFIKNHRLENIHKHDEHIYLLLPLEFNNGSGHAYNDY